MPLKMNNPGCPCCGSIYTCNLIGAHYADEKYIPNGTGWSSDEWIQAAGDWSFSNSATTEDSNARLVWDEFGDFPYQKWFVTLPNADDGAELIAGITDESLDNQIYVLISIAIAGSYPYEYTITAKVYTVTSGGSPVLVTTWTSDPVVYAAGNAPHLMFLYDEDYSRFHFWLRVAGGDGPGGPYNVQWFTQKLDTHASMRRPMVGTGTVAEDEDAEFSGRSEDTIGHDYVFAGTTTNAPKLHHGRCWDWLLEPGTDSYYDYQPRMPCEATITISGVAAGDPVQTGDTISHWSWFNDDHDAITHSKVDRDWPDTCDGGDTIESDFKYEDPGDLDRRLYADYLERSPVTEPHDLIGLPVIADENLMSAVSFYALYDPEIDQTILRVECYLFCGFYGDYDPLTNPFGTYTYIRMLAKFGKTVDGQVDPRTFDEEPMPFIEQQVCYQGYEPINDLQDLIDWSSAVCTVTGSP